MQEGRSFNKKPTTRPKKKPAERRRREKLHRTRLIALGVDEAIVSKMQPPDVRRMLQHPAKTKIATA